MMSEVLRLHENPQNPQKHRREMKELKVEPGPVQLLQEPQSAPGVQSSCSQSHLKQQHVRTGPSAECLARHSRSGSDSVANVIDDPLKESYYREDSVKDED